MAVLLNRPPAPRVTSYGPYGASAVAAPYRPTAQGYALGPTPQRNGLSPLEHAAGGWGNYDYMNQNYGQAAGVPRAGGVGGVGGGLPGGGVGPYNPNININPYAGLIGGDYGVQGMESLMNAQMGTARGNFQSQLRQSLIDLGVVDPSSLGNLGQYIDANTIQQAAANKYSQTAQLQQQQTIQDAQSQAQLAARGLLSSGQLTTDQEASIREAEQGRYTALRSFLAGGAQGLGSLAQMNDQLAMQLAQARADAAMRAAQTYGWLDPSQWGAYGRTDTGPMYGGGGGGYTSQGWPGYQPAATPPAQAYAHNPWYTYY